MNRMLKIGLTALIALYLGSASQLYGQFMRTRISLPPGIELASRGMPGQIRPEGEISLFQGEKTFWVELRAMVNLQLVVDYEVGNALIPMEGELIALTDGSENFANAQPTSGLGFVLIENPRRLRRNRSGFRPYSAWLGIPYHRRGTTTIHYP